MFNDGSFLYNRRFKGNWIGARELLHENHILVCTARSKNDELIELAEEKGVHLAFIEYDLAQTGGLENLIDTMVSYIPGFPESVTLINNAGVIDPIGNTEDNSPGEIERSISVNLIAPMILTSAFIHRLRDKHVPKRVVNVSSGAGRHAYAGWSSYCAGKAGLDHYSRAVSLEQKREPYGVKIISVAPGIIDTDMQKRIRSTNKNDFELVDQFKGYKDKGLLSSPEETAKGLVQLMKHEDFSSVDVITDLRNL